MCIDPERPPFNKCRFLSINLTMCSQDQISLIWGSPLFWLDAYLVRADSKYRNLSKNAVAREVFYKRCQLKIDSKTICDIPVELKFATFPPLR